MDGNEPASMIEDMEKEIDELREDRDFYKDLYLKKYEEAKGATLDAQRIEQDLRGAYMLLERFIGFARGVAVALPLNERAAEFAREVEEMAHHLSMCHDYPPKYKKPQDAMI